jgi:hypothetical protein
VGGAESLGARLAGRKLPQQLVKAAVAAVGVTLLGSAAHR